MFSFSYQDDERNNQLNHRLYNRNIPGQAMNISTDPRPQSTKYTFLPSVSNEPLLPNLYPLYDAKTDFHPGTKSPYSGYAVNVDDESKIQNIFMPNQKYAPQVYYVPSSKSELYNTPSFVHHPTTKHTLLQTETQFSAHNPDKRGINDNSFLFQTHTRQSEKNVPLWSLNQY